MIVQQIIHVLMVVLAQIHLVHISVVAPMDIPGKIVKMIEMIAYQPLKLIHTHDRNEKGTERTNPCLNGGRCVDELNGYHCECLVGFTGRQCATNIDECESLPCENGASCIDHVNGFECVCRRGFSGTFCQTNDNDCQSG
ncbi:unnamed protein product [Litomosoides sigmodontis]|uniref:EGF-like domain-containing protein n=1 Tax=Litomosoides sigmodontis TaxID=42156 RepID=A0A3P6V5P7_LITSI|nr:unnamed protein product [Litomosoides sigmodontis]